ncbi:MAG: tRNA (adenosine(37)-N6)-threonylcarbamoyltransferase complex ATPase subunit type 1 TsaE [Anaerolineae bacterium]
MFSNLTLISHDVSQTKTIGASIARLLTRGDVICLQGNLGSGKTSLTQGIGQGLQINDTINSPTFVFIREHRPAKGGLYLYHVDLYRIDNPLDISSLGLADYMYGDGVTVIEWAERARESMPANCLWIKIEFLGDTERRLVFEAHGKRYETLLEALRSSLDEVKFPVEELEGKQNAVGD